MVKINIITVGNLKENYLRQAVAEYTKRLGRFADIKIIELDESPLPPKPSEALIEKALDKEADKILAKLTAPTRIALCVEGKQRSSESFAELLGNAMDSGGADFVIGSSHGLSPRVKSACNCRLSFSQMTFPHQLMRLILVEQIYRGFKINHGESYHK